MRGNRTEIEGKRNPFYVTEQFYATGKNTPRFLLARSVPAKMLASRALLYTVKRRSFTVALNAHPLVKIERFTPALATPTRRASRARRDVATLPSCFVAFFAENYLTLHVLAVLACDSPALLRAPTFGAILAAK